MQLLDSLKDQEENLIVVKMWTWKREGRGKKKRKHTRQSAIVPASAQTYCKTLCSCLRTALTWHTHTHTQTHMHTQTASFKFSFIVLKPREQNMQFDRRRGFTSTAWNLPTHCIQKGPVKPKVAKKIHNYSSDFHLRQLSFSFSVILFCPLLALIV